MSRCLDEACARFTPPFADALSYLFFDSGDGLTRPTVAAGVASETFDAHASLSTRGRAALTLDKIKATVYANAASVHFT